MFVQLLCILLLIWVIFENEGLLIKVDVLARNAPPRFDLRAYKFQNFSWGSMPPDPLDRADFMVYARPLMSVPPS